MNFATELRSAMSLPREQRASLDLFHNAANEIDRQAARIRELEGALRMMVEQYGCLMRITRGVNPDVNGDPYVAQARAALGKAARHA